MIILIGLLFAAAFVALLFSRRSAAIDVITSPLCLLIVVAQLLGSFFLYGADRIAAFLDSIHERFVDEA